MNDSYRHTAYKVIFHEEQRLRQVFLRGMMVCLNLLVLSLFGYGIFSQVVMGRPWGNRPMSDAALVLVAAFTLLVIGGVTYLLFTARLMTEVRSDGLYVRFIPFHRDFRKIGWSEIRSFETRVYRPIREYSGWGIRYGSRGMAYNVSGNRGVRLELEDGKRILIGSQKADELAAAIASASGKSPAAAKVVKP